MGTLPEMDWLERIFAGCNHEWQYRRIYGDARLTLGRIEEWYCPKCRRIRANAPKD